MDKAKKSKLALFRKITQISIFLFLFIGGTINVLAEKGIQIPFLPAISAHSVCPLGGVETAYTLATTGKFVSKVHTPALIMLLLAVVITLLFGAVFCGWICPLGTVQELVGKLGKKLFPKHYNKLMPKSADRILRFTRYFVLAVILYYTAAVGKLIFMGYDPFYAIMNIFSGEVMMSAFVVLGVIVVLSLIIERPFCKYACPLGSVVGTVSMLSFFKLRRNAQSCIGCKKCDRGCPMNLEVSTVETVNSHQCIACYKCISGENCPVNDTVYISTAKPSQAGNVKGAAVNEN